MVEIELDRKTIAIIAVVALALILFGPSLFTSFQVLSTGFATLALSVVNYVSNDPSLNAPAFLLSVVQNDQGEYAVGSISANDIRYGDKQASKDFKIEMFVDLHQARYPVKMATDENAHFYIANYETTEFWTYPPQYWFDDCAAKGDITPWSYIKGGLKYKATCIWFLRDTTLGIVTQRNIVFESRLKGTIGTEYAEAKISNMGSTSALLKNPVTGSALAYASWLGNLVSGDEPPAPSAFGKVAWASWKTPAQWIDISETKYDTYKSYLDIGLEACMNNYLDGIVGYDPQTCTAKFNDLENIALSPLYVRSDGGSLATSTGTESLGVFVINLKKLIQYPVITLKVNAEKLGVYTPIGMPKIIEASSPEKVETGKAFYITVRGKNIGAVAASFAVKASCIGASNPNTEFMSLESNAEGTVYLTSYASTGSNIPYSCKITMYDRNNPTLLTEATVKGTVLPLVICKPGDRRSNGMNIEQCNIDGSGWYVIQTCGAGEYAGWQNGVLQCLKTPIYTQSPYPTPPPDGGCAAYDLPCQMMQMLFGFLKGLFVAFGVVIGLAVVAVIGYVIIKKIIIDWLWEKIR